MEILLLFPMPPIYIHFRAILNRCLFRTAIVLVICSISSTEAIASCGDYLHRTKSSGSPGSNLNSFDAVARAEHFIVSPTSDEPPCHGPNCRQQVPTPLPPAPATVVSPVDELAVSLVDGDVTLPSIVQRLEIDRLFSFDGHPFRITRPPRA